MNTSEYLDTCHTAWQLDDDRGPFTGNGLKAAVAGLRGGGIGEAIARRLAADGYKVVGCDRDHQAGLEAVEGICRAGGAAAFVQADVATEAGVECFMDEIARAAGRLTVLVCNAGSAGDPREDDILGVTVAKIHRLIDDNLTTACLLTSRALERFLLPQGPGGSVTFIGSNNGQRGLGALGQPLYGAAKTALSALLAHLVARFGRQVRFNLVRPGPIMTNSENWQRRLKAAKDWPQLEGSYIPAGRLGEPADVAGAVSFLASDNAKWVNGAELSVDGGTYCAGLQFPGLSPLNFRESYVQAVREWELARKQKAA